MKKLTLLLLLSPLLGFAQEMPIAWNNGSDWVVSDQVKDQAQLALDSVASGVYTVDSAWVYMDSTIQIGFSSGAIRYTDFMVGTLSGDTIYTQPDMYNCGVTCKNYNECIGGSCYKTTSCKCACTADGGCSEIWISIFRDMTLWKVLRERILIFNGHYIPE